MNEPIAPLIGHEVKGETEILRDVANQPGLETIEGRLVPLLSAERIKSHIIVMHPGQYAAPHAHPTESIIYTISGSWVSSTITEDGDELRSVVNEGDLFTFGDNVPTGYETPFDDPAVILILKGGSATREEMEEGMRSAKAILDKESAEGEPFSYAELDADHPAAVFAKEVTGRNPVEHFGGA